MIQRLVYVSRSTLPSTDANAVHVAQMCDAFAGLGYDVTLRAWRGGKARISEAYGLRHPFHVAYEGDWRHALWLGAHRLMRGQAGRKRTIYYGRRIAPLAQLASWGYPTAFELHSPPTKGRQPQHLRQLVDAPGFRGLVAISHQLRDEMLRRLPGVDPDKILVEPDAVRADAIHPPRIHPGSGTRVVYCGAFHPGKGIEVLLPAAALAPEMQFDVIGGTPAQIAAAQGAAPPNVRFLGYLSHLEAQRRLPDYDIAVAPYLSVVLGVQTSRDDDRSPWMSPLKIFEYMGAGLPIITTDLPVLREILSHGETALLTPPEDIGALVSALRTLSSDQALRLRLANAAQQRLREHTWEARAGRILSFLSPSS